MTCTLLALLPFLQCWDQGGPCGLQPPVWVSRPPGCVLMAFYEGRGLALPAQRRPADKSFAQQVPTQ